MTTRGWVVYADGNYLPLLDVMLESLAIFSRYPVAVFSPHPISYFNPNIRCFYQPDTHSTYLSKLLSAIETPFDESCLIDADTVAAHNVDDCWRLFQPTDRPTFCLHEWATEERVYKQVRHLNDKPCMPFVHSSPCFYGRAAIPWLRRAAEWMRELEASGKPEGDEEVINALLWKDGPAVCLPHMFIDRTNLGKWPLPFYAVHGEKDPESAKALLQLLNCNRKNFRELAYK